MKLKTEFTFDAAHRLVGYEGKCSNLHGHMWRVEIEIEGKKLDNVGILWDFTNVKKIKELFDHKTILKDCSENFVLQRMTEETCGDGSTYMMEKNPTAENLAELILYTCHNLSPTLKFRIKVYESPKSYAEVEG